MIDVRELNELELDGLKEVANIGAGHAATALSQLTGRRIVVDVPALRILRLEEVPELTGDPEEVVAVVVMQVLGDATGRTVQVFPAEAARALAGILLGRPAAGPVTEFDELQRSALKEAANILAGAYLNALSEFLGMLLLTSVPAFAVDMAGALLTASQLSGGEPDDHVLCIDTLFRMDDRAEAVRGHFILLPDRVALRIILRARGLARA